MLFGYKKNAVFSVHTYQSIIKRMYKTHILSVNCYYNVKQWLNHKWVLPPQMRKMQVQDW